MNPSATSMLALLVALLTAASPASAALRVPQVPVVGGGLQGYLIGVGETINVLTDQDATQTWSHTVSGTTTYTIQLQNTLVAGSQQFGMYNASAVIPPLFFLMSGAVGSLGFSTATFKPGNILTVNRFDANANFLSTTTFGGIDPTNFGFYVSNNAGTVFTQDSRNAGEVHALTYQGTGANAGTWWLCWDEAQIGQPSNQDFDDLVVLMESVNPTPVSKTSWGVLKSRFR